MHNGRLADPLDPVTKELSRISHKKSKTDDIHLELSRVEWYGSLYHTGAAPEVSDAGICASPDARLVLPAPMIEATVVDGARKSRKGEIAKSGSFVEEDAEFEYDGPKDINKLWASGQHLHRVGVCVKMNRVMRSRPIFRTWSAKFVLTLDPATLNESDAFEILKTAGQLVGLGDNRPRFGRFEVTRG
jgi:hypothetical protein